MLRLFGSLVRVSAVGLVASTCVPDAVELVAPFGPELVETYALTFTKGDSSRAIGMMVDSVTLSMLGITPVVLHTRTYASRELGGRRARA